MLTYFLGGAMAIYCSGLSLLVLGSMRARNADPGLWHHRTMGERLAFYTVLTLFSVLWPVTVPGALLFWKCRNEI